VSTPINDVLFALRACISGASLAESPDVKVLYLAHARMLLGRADEEVTNARATLEALERELARKNRTEP
jgi:hypothetical protein